MKWNNKFTYPKSSRSLKNGFRHYLFDNNKLPSVTSILQATKSEEDKAALENWKQRVGYKEANKLRVLNDGEILKSQACLIISKLSLRKPGIKKIISLLIK